MNPDKLLKWASYFERLAQNEVERIDLRDKILNTPLVPHYQYSFSQIANVLFAELEKKSPGIQDAGSSQGPVYQLMDLINAHSVPDPQRLISLSQQVAAKTKEVDIPPSEATGLSQHLVRYAQLLVNKFFSGNNTAPSGSNTLQVPETTIVGDKPQSAPPSAPQSTPASESSYQFISRVYRQIRMGQNVSDEDKQKWPNYKTSVVRRLNGLKGMATRTPVQDQEMTVLQSLVDKLG